MFSFFKKLLTILFSNGFYQIVNFFSLPFLTKVYESSSFGSFYFYMSISSVIYVFFNFKADWCIPKTKDEELERFLSLVLVRSFLVFSILIGFSCWLGEKYFFTVTLALLFTLDETFFIYNNRRNLYTLSAVLQMTQCSLFILIALFVCKNLENGLIISYILSYSITTIYNISKLTLSGFKRIGLKNIFKCTKRQTSVMLGCFLQKIRLHMPSIFIPFCFDMFFAGIWGILTRLINGPTAVLANKVSDVVFQEFGTCIREKQSTQKLFKKVFYVIFITSLFILLTVSFCGDLFCDLFFPEKWEVNPSYLRCLLFGAWSYFLYSCFKQILILYNRTKYYLYWHLLFALTTSLVFLLQYFWNYSFQTFLNLISYTQALFCLWNLYVIKKVVYSQIEEPDDGVIPINKKHC